MAGSDLVIYPTAAARTAAERSGTATPGLILRHPLRTESRADPVPRWTQGPLRVLVPSTNQPHKNLALLGRLSSVMSDRGVDHQIRVTAELPPSLTSANVVGGFSYDGTSMSTLRDQFDAVLIPSTTESYSYPLVEFERLGFPVAASNIDAHQELRVSARLFDPASPHGAADALLAAVADAPPAPHEEGDEDEWRFRTPAGYAAAVSDEMDRLLDDGAPWAP